MQATTPESFLHIARITVNHRRSQGYTIDDELADRAIAAGIKAAEAVNDKGGRSSETRAALDKAMNQVLADARPLPNAADIKPAEFTPDEVKAKRVYFTHCKARSEDGEVVEVESAIAASSTNLLRQICQTRGHGETEGRRMTVEDIGPFLKRLNPEPAPEVEDDSPEPDEDDKQAATDPAASLLVHDTDLPNVVKNAIIKAGLSDLVQLAEYGNEHDGDFTGIKGVAEASSEKIVAMLDAMRPDDENPEDEADAQGAEPSETDAEPA